MTTQSATSNTVLAERYITSTRDMDDIEAAITAELQGENHRCAFLRSQAYLLLRMAALYKAQRTPYTVYHENICVCLDWTPTGKRVTVRSVDRRAYNDGTQPNEEPNADAPCWEQRKAPRLSSL